MKQTSERLRRSLSIADAEQNERYFQTINEFVCARNSPNSDGTTWQLQYSPTIRNPRENTPMRKLVLTCIAAVLAVAPMASVVKAEDTTVIKRDHHGDRTVIEKKEQLNVLPVPHTEEKTIIKKERD
jgi:hypothetical protein